MKNFILLLSSLIVAPLWAQTSTSEAVCTILRVDLQTERTVRDTVRAPLNYRITAPLTATARASLLSGLMPSYRIEFTNVSAGRGDRLTVRTVRRSNGQVMSSFSSRILVNNSRGRTSQSAYVARPKNIFMSDSDQYVLDVTCYENRR